MPVRWWYSSQSAWRVSARGRRQVRGGPEGQHLGRTRGRTARDVRCPRETSLGGKKAKAEKARQALIAFNSKSSGKANIIKFILPICDPALAPSKFTTIAKAKAKLKEIEKQKGKTWTVLVEEEVEKVLGEVESEAAQLEETTTDVGGSDTDADALGADAELVADEVPDEGPTVQAE